MFETIKDDETSTGDKISDIVSDLFLGMVTGLIVFPDLDEQIFDNYGFIFITLIANFVILLTLGWNFDTLKPLKFVFNVLIVVFVVLYIVLGGAIELFDRLR